jgi:hypothetical protein
MVDLDPSKPEKLLEFYQGCLPEIKMISAQTEAFKYSTCLND